MTKPIVPSVIKTIKIPQELVDQIEAYRAAHNFRSWTYALMHLASIGLTQQGYDPVELRPWARPKNEAAPK
jgi:hypothetical protein